MFCIGCGFSLQPGPMLSCPSCNASARPNAQFCLRCGQTLKSVEVTCPACQTANRSEAKFCRHCQQPLTTSTPSTPCPACGKPNNPTARFCRSCGAAIPVEATTPCLQCGFGMRTNARFCPQCGSPPQRQVQKRYETGKLPPHTTITGSDGETYLITSLIAKGGMGAVYKAIRPSDNTLWALKEMSESGVAMEDREQALNAFYEEAGLLQTLEHENLPKVLDVFKDSQSHYMVMDFIDGDTLTEKLAQAGSAVDEVEVVQWAKQLCVVLDYLHTHNPPIIYRDLKPDNVMIEKNSNCVKLIDFGIARRFKGGKKSDTVHLGTSGYAAPEQYGKSEQQSDATTDLYALGGTLHHLLTGLDPAQSPFHFADIRVHAKVSDNVADAITKAVKLRPMLRYQSAAEMYEALTDEAFPVSVRPQVAQELKPKPQPQSQIASMPKTPVRAKGTAVSTPILPTTSLQLAGVVKGTRKLSPLPVKVTTGALDVSADVTWLDVSPDVVDKTNHEIELVVSTSHLWLKHDKWPVAYQPGNLFGKIWWWVLWLVHAHARYLVPHPTTHHATVFVGQEKATVEIEVVPSDGRVTTGWLLSGTAVLAELAGISWLIVFMLLLFGL